MPKKQKHKKKTQSSIDATPRSISRPALLVAAVCAVAAVALRLARPEVMPQRLTRNMRVRKARRAVPCRTAACSTMCDRVVIDDWLPPAEIDALRDIARRGAAAADAAAASGGPTIVDINSGFVMAPGARLVNLYQTKSKKPFGGEDYELYRSVIRRLKAEVEAAFPRASALYFTAPTFLTRLSGENATWEASEPHDEYYQWHVDRENTPHYEFSGLLYLSDYEEVRSLRKILDVSLVDLHTGLRRGPLHVRRRVGRRAAAGAPEHVRVGRRKHASCGARHGRPAPHAELLVRLRPGVRVPRFPGRAGPRAVPELS